MCINIPFSRLPAHDDRGPAGRGGLPLHRGRLQLLPQVLQQERRRGRAGYEMRRHDDRKSPVAAKAAAPSARLRPKKTMRVHSAPPPPVLPVPHVRGRARRRRNRRRDRGPRRRRVRAVPGGVRHNVLLLRHRHPAGHHSG